MFTPVVIVALLLLAGFTPVASAQDEASANGVGSKHGSFSLVPWERVDAFSGNAVLSFTDFSLPGNAGFNLTVGRVYNTKGGGWNWTIGLPRMILGSFPAIIFEDGSIEHLARVQGDIDTHYTTSFWRFHAATRVLDSPRGVTYTYDVMGYPTSAVDRFGNRLDVTWSPWSLNNPKRVQQVVQSLGNGQSREVLFSYDESGHVTAVSAVGRTWQYRWENYNLAEAISPSGASWHFDYTWAYGESGAIDELTTRVTAPQGGWVYYKVNMLPADGSLRSEAYALTRRESGGPDVTAGAWDFTYSQNGIDNQYTAIDGANGTAYHAEYSHDGTRREVPLRYVIIGSGLATERTDYTWESGVNVGWDPNVSAWAAPLLPTRVAVTLHGQVFERLYTYAQTNFNHFGQPTSLVETGHYQRTTNYEYQGFSALYLADAVTATTVQSGGQSMTTTTEYEGSTGFVTARTAQGVRTAFGHDDFGNVNCQTVGDGLPEALTTTYDHTMGVVSAIHAPDGTVEMDIRSDGSPNWTRRAGQTTTFTYDDAGRLISTQPPIGNATVTTYAADGTWVKVARGGAWKKTLADGLGRNMGTEDGAGVRTTERRDAMGRTTFSSYPFTGSGDGPGVSLEYDDLGRVTRRTNPDNSFITYSYDARENGLQTEITDELDRQTTQIFQASGSPSNARLVAVDAAGQTSTYTYNGMGSLEQVVSGGLTRTWTYDANQRLTGRSEPESGTLAYEYDPLGRLSASTNARNQRTAYTYDSAGRLTNSNVPADPHYSTTVAFDASGNRSLLTNGYVASSFTYDELNRLTSRTDLVDGQSFTTTYSFDDNGNLVDVEYPSGNRASYEYDGANRVVRIFDPIRNSTLADQITYHPSGGLASYRSADGTAHTFSYDARYRPDRLVAGTLLDLTYHYDAGGNVTTIEDSRPGMTASFEYDALNRLTRAIGGGWGELQYSYDTRSNRDGVREKPVGAQAFTDTSYHYDSANRLERTDGQTPTENLLYDASGNLTQDAIGAYTHTPTQMLETGLVGGGTGALYTYRYDGDNQRVLRFAGSGTDKRFFTYGLGQLLSEWEGTGTGAQWSVDYVYLGSRLVASLSRPTTNAELTVTLSGSGSVTGASGLIACPGTCSATVTSGTPATLSATPAIGFSFAGWTGTGACSTPSSANPRALVVLEATTCTATFIQATPPLSKTSPSHAATLVPGPVTLQWALAAGVTFEYCYDTTNNGACDTSWHATGTTAQANLGTLGPGLYYWQVRGNGTTYADGGAWWSFTVTAPPPVFHKVTPANGTTGLGPRVGLHWEDVAGASYQYCIDRINNNACDDSWRPIAHSWPDLWYVQPGTYYWQVRAITAGGTVEADGGTWWTYTVFQYDRLLPDQQLDWDHDSRWSLNGAYHLVYQGDGNLVLYGPGGPVWATGTAGSSFGVAAMQGDGNFVLYNAGWAVLWHTSTGGHPGAWLRVEDDGRIVIYSAAGSELTSRPLPTYTLSLVKEGDGAGASTVTATPGGISCGGTCSAGYEAGTTVTLGAEAAPGYLFVGWSGDAGCWSGTVSMDGPKTCVATFAADVPLCDPDGSQQWDCENNGGRWDSETCSCQPLWEDPLILFFENGPPSLTGLTTGVLFDVDGDGRREPVAWTAGGSMAAFLALDRNGNGLIDSGVELFGRPASGVGQGGKPAVTDNGFARLAELDQIGNGGNGDGMVSAADAAFARLLLWTDRNHDGVSQPNELASLRGAGIERIELVYQAVGRRDQGDNFYRYRGTVHLTNGKRLTLWDVFLKLQQPASAPDPVPESAAPIVVPQAWTTPEETTELTALEAADEPVVAGLTSAYPSAPEPPAVVIVHYYHTDALGSVRVVTDALGREVARHDFKPFGEELTPADPPAAGKLFAGQLRDVELKQDYLNARQLSFRHGRFAAPDPLDARAKLANPQSFNRYAYVLNNPLRFVDPSGLDEEPSQDYAMEAGDRLDPWDLPGDRGESISLTLHEQYQLFALAFEASWLAQQVATQMVMGYSSSIPYGDKTPSAVRQMAITVLLSGNEAARKNAYSEYNGAVCRNSETRKLRHTGLTLLLAGGSPVACNCGEVKVADYHRHSWAFGNPWPSPEDRRSTTSYNFVWTPAHPRDDRGIVLQFQGQSTWLVYGPAGYVPPLFR